ncbi:MAG: hypothetical protein COA79_19225 [Planctomycetota bacterium]|nr:MAG: hypothetical protein COA79_19225 [Planctomycetota bacterium]
MNMLKKDKLDVACVGVVVVDALSGPITDFPIPKVKTQVNTDKIEFLVGGGAANTSSALAQLGIKCSIFSSIGDDMNGQFIRDSLVENGVNVSQLKVKTETSTPFTYVALHEEGERTFIHTPGVNMIYALDDICLVELLKAKVLVYQDLFVMPSLDGNPAAELLKKSKEAGQVVVLDECYGLGPQKQKLEMLLPYVDYFLPSYDDLKIIYPALTPEEMINYFEKFGSIQSILKLGKRGCLAKINDKFITFPSVSKNIIDTTGAGDCFDAGFIAGLCSDYSISDSIILGQKVASHCIAHVSGAENIPSLDNI